LPPFNSAHNSNNQATTKENKPKMKSTIIAALIATLTATTCTAGSARLRGHQAEREMKANLQKPLVVSGDGDWKCFYDRTMGDYGCYYSGHDSSKSYFLAYCDKPISADGHPTPENCNKCTLSVLPDPDKLSPNQSPGIRRFCKSCGFAANPPAGQDWAVEHDCTNRISGPHSRVQHGSRPGSQLNTKGI
jgi:hypothetical protein